MKKSKLKSLLREAFIAGGRYYIKPHIKENIGKTEDFDSWYMNNVSERVDKPKPSESTEPKALIIDSVVRQSEQLVCSCGSIKVQTTGGSQCPNNRCSSAN